MTPGEAERRRWIERVRADVAAAYGDGIDWKARAEAAELTVARLRAALLEGGQDADMVRRNALTILMTCPVGSGEGKRRG